MGLLFSKKLPASMRRLRTSFCFPYHSDLRGHGQGRVSGTSSVCASVGVIGEGERYLGRRSGFLVEGGVSVRARSYFAPSDGRPRGKIPVFHNTLGKSIVILT